MVVRLVIGVGGNMIRQQLRVECDGRPVTSYRMNDNRLEVRIDSGDPQHRGWEPLSEGDILLHLNLNTIVAKWVQTRCPGLVHAIAAKLPVKPNCRAIAGLLF
jgi:hypothetical protein